MKTSEHILDTARRLFNERGEASVTASDIALELGISPGNLHYHFKGKASIHIAIFAQMQRELIVLMGPVVQAPGLFSGTRVTSDIEPSWLFLTVLLEKMFQYRYFYDSPKTLMVQFPEVARGFRRLLRMKHKSCSSIASQLVPGPGGLPHPRLPKLTEAMTLCLSCWLAYDPLVNPTDPDSLRTHRGVLQILSHCAPYLGDEQLDFYRDCEALYHQMIHAEVTALD